MCEFFNFQCSIFANILWPPYFYLHRNPLGLGRHRDGLGSPTRPTYPKLIGWQISSRVLVRQCGLYPKLPSIIQSNIPCKFQVIFLVTPRKLDIHWGNCVHWEASICNINSLCSIHIRLQIHTPLNASYNHWNLKVHYYHGYSILATAKTYFFNSNY